MGYGDGGAVTDCSDELRIELHEFEEMIAEQIAPTIDAHRKAVQQKDPGWFEMVSGQLGESPTPEEVYDLLVSCPGLDPEFVERTIQLSHVGFPATGDVSRRGLDDILKKARDWSQNDRWLTADLPWIGKDTRTCLDTEIWTPAPDGSLITPPSSWSKTGPACMLLAADLLRSGRLLQEMPWRSFEELIGELLTADGWRAVVTQPTRDGGVDVVAERDLDETGLIRVVWQAKRYSGKSLVRLNMVRELAAVRENIGASKAFIATTSRLTSDALQYVRRDKYRLGALEGPQLEHWVRRVLLLETDSL